jgi:hypothetical protein
MIHLLHPSLQSIGNGAACYLCRTVSEEALAPGSKVASEASESLKAFLAIIPEDLKVEAQKFRVERAKR